MDKHTVLEVMFKSRDIQYTKELRAALNSNQVSPEKVSEALNGLGLRGFGFAHLAAIAKRCPELFAQSWYVMRGRLDELGRSLTPDELLEEVMTDPSILLVPPTPGP
jgi:hypothetical protein